MSKTEKAFVAPFLIFLAFIGVVEFLQKVFEGTDSLWLESPQYWVFPIQTMVCGAIVWRYRRIYPRGVSQWFYPVGIGVLVFLIWVSPQELFGLPRRFDGFNPFAAGSNPWVVGGMLLFRFLRLVVVVPLVEEIFWRGYLLRHLVHHDFSKVPVGTFSWGSFAIVTIAFMLVHRPVDYPAALLTGALFNVVAYRTKSIGSCVISHAVTNALLGVYIVATRQWGFW